ncbi:MAG: hypothetical protein AAF823_01375 [Planctomycetota bacterium]
MQTFINFYITHRPHQGLDNRVPDDTTMILLRFVQEKLSVVGRVGCGTQLRGLFKHYYRVAT